MEKPSPTGKISMNVRVTPISAEDVDSPGFMTITIAPRTIPKYVNIERIIGTRLFIISLMLEYSQLMVNEVQMSLLYSGQMHSFPRQ
jgi:hypothetical protein